MNPKIIALIKKLLPFLIILLLAGALMLQESLRKDIKKKNVELIEENTHIMEDVERRDSIITEMEIRTDTLLLQDSLQRIQDSLRIQWLTRSLRRTQSAYNDLYGKIQGDTVECIDSAQMAQIVRTAKELESCNLSRRTLETVIKTQDTTILLQDSSIQDLKHIASNWEEVHEKDETLIETARRYFNSKWYQPFKKWRLRRKFSKNYDKR